MKWELTDCKYGDMIRVRCGSVFHYGIYVNDDEVIEFGYPPTLRDKDKDNIVVNSVDIDTFSCGNFIEIGICDKKELKKIAKKTATAADAVGDMVEDRVSALRK